MRLIVLFWLFLLLVPVVYASQDTIKLLAISELSNGSQVGAVTDLTLELKPGSAHVYLDTFPLAKIDTQISMRFAQQIACKELGVVCSNYDFFYTIKALMGLVGGPSAGAAATVLTASLITGESIDKTMTITGTINSGGLIGPVGNVKQKIEAAAKNGVKTVLIPRGSKIQHEGNKTINLVDYGKKLSLNIVEVSTFEEAFDKFTGKNYSSNVGELVIDDKYKNVMKEVANDICGRNNSLKSVISFFAVNKSVSEKVLSLSNESSQAFSNGQYYSAASYCFQTNLLLKEISIMAKIPSRVKIFSDALNATSLLNSIVANLSGRKLRTITDLQTYMAVDERLFDASDALGKLRENSNDVLASANLVAYAQERLGSAVAWSKFFGNNDKHFEISNAELEQSCMNKISEAEERYSYVKSILPVSLSETRQELDRAYYDLANQSFVMCLYRASKAKATSDVVLSVIGVENSQLNDLIKLKLDIVKRELIKSQQGGIFPIIGYSYYEYAGSLINVDKPSALLFAEYALELTNLDMYFNKRTYSLMHFVVTRENGFVFVLGFIFGVLVIKYYSRIKKLGLKLRKRFKSF